MNRQLGKMCYVVYKLVKSTVTSHADFDAVHGCLCHAVSQLLQSKLTL